MLAECNKDINKGIMNKITKLDIEYPRFNYNGIDDVNMKNVNDIIEPELEEKCVIHQLKNFQGVFYNVANHDLSAIHSEPLTDEPRIMLALLINEL